MEFSGKIAIKRNSKDKWRKFFLEVGMISIVCSIVTNLMLGTYLGLIMIIPFLYLLNIKKSMDKAACFQDVIISVCLEGTAKIIEISNRECLDGKRYSVRFTIDNSGKIAIIYRKKYNKVNLMCRADKVLILDDEEIPYFDDMNVNIELHMEEKEVKNLAELLEAKLYMRF